MSDAGLVCANIGPKQRRLRLVWGIALTAAGVLLAGYLWWVGQPWYVRAAVLVPAFFAVLSFLEVRCRTCVLLAEVGRQNLDTGTQAVGDADLARQLRSVARRIYWQSLLVGLAVTGVYLVVSELRSQG